MSHNPTLRLGLIGDHIADSVAPRFHQFAGAQTGLQVDYTLLVPCVLQQSFEQVFQQAGADGYRGLNITYPYKERVVPLVRVTHRHAMLGAVNTVIFEPDGPVGYNTDYSGFLRAYRHADGHAEPGHVCLVGAGGVGRAIGFALCDLGAQHIQLIDADETKARALADELSAYTHARVATSGATEPRLDGKVDGFVNCTPVGMTGQPGSVLRTAQMCGGRWAFDAVYTPRNTQFLSNAQRAGLTLLSGFELFFFQGVDAFEIFTECTASIAALRQELDSPSENVTS
jgi:shikimate dehydrogenase